MFVRIIAVIHGFSSAFFQLFFFPLFVPSSLWLVKDAAHT